MVAEYSVAGNSLRVMRVDSNQQDAETLCNRVLLESTESALHVTSCKHTRNSMERLDNSSFQHIFSFTHFHTVAWCRPRRFTALHTSCGMILQTLLRTPSLIAIDRPDFSFNSIFFRSWHTSSDWAVSNHVGCQAKPNVWKSGNVSRHATYPSSSSLGSFNLMSSCGRSGHNANNWDLQGAFRF